MNQNMGTLPQIEEVPITPEAEVPVGPTGVATPARHVAQTGGNSKVFTIAVWAIVIVFGGALLFMLGFYLPTLLGK